MDNEELEEYKKRFKEVLDKLENGLYEDGVEEGDLLNEKDFLEELLWNE